MDFLARVELAEREAGGVVKYPMSVAPATSPAPSELVSVSARPPPQRSHRSQNAVKGSSASAAADRSSSGEHRRVSPTREIRVHDETGGVAQRLVNAQAKALAGNTGANAAAAAKLARGRRPIGGVGGGGTPRPARVGGGGTPRPAALISGTNRGTPRPLMQNRGTPRPFAAQQALAMGKGGTPPFAAVEGPPSGVFDAAGALGRGGPAPQHMEGLAEAPS